MADTRSDNPRTELTIQSVWDELQAFEAEFRSMQSLNSGNIGLTGVVNGYLKSPDFISGSKGWQLSPNGDFEGNSGTFRGALTGNTITGATIIGGIIETASGTGQRIVMAGSDNTLRFYDSTNSQVIGIATTANTAITLALNSTTTSGIVVTSSVAGYAFSYTNSLSNLSGNAGIQLTLSGTSNTAANISITNNGTTGAQGILMTLTGTAVGMYIGNTGATYSLQIVSTTSADAININSTVAGNSVALFNGTISATSGSPSGLNLTMSSSSGTCTAFTLSIAGSGSNSYLFSHAASGMIVTSAVGGTQNKKIRVNIAGAVYFIPLYDA